MKLYRCSHTFLPGRESWDFSKLQVYGPRSLRITGLAHSGHAININAFFPHPFSSFKCCLCYDIIKKEIISVPFYYVSYVRAWIESFQLNLVPEKNLASPQELACFFLLRKLWNLTCFDFCSGCKELRQNQYMSHKKIYIYIWVIDTVISSINITYSFLFSLIKPLHF